MREALLAVVLTAASALVVAGVALLSTSAALVVAGVLVAAIGYIFLAEVG